MLLDLDLEEEKESKSTEFTRNFEEKFRFLLGDIDLSTFEKLEAAAFSYIILRTLINPYIRFNVDERSSSPYERSSPSPSMSTLEFFNAFSHTLIQECQKRLKYNTTLYYPSVCARCFSYDGHIIGGDVKVYCGYCLAGYGNEEGAKIYTTDFIQPTFLGHCGYLFPATHSTEEYRQKMAWSTIFEARLIYNFFARSYHG